MTTQISGGLLALLAFASPLATPPLHAQGAPDNSIRRYEIGMQASALRAGGCIGLQYCTQPQFTLGPAASLVLNPHLSIDAGYLIGTGYDPGYGIWPNGSITGGRESQFLVGPRAEVRARHYGYFLEAKPGLLNWSHAITGYKLTRAPAGGALETDLYGSRHFFASEVGAGIEYSPGGRFHIRGDVDDLLIRYVPSSVSLVGNNIVWRNNLQATVSVYASVGRPLAWKPPTYNAMATHRFLGPSNFLPLYASALGITADAISTQRFVDRGAREGDPLTAPFVKYGWSGQLAISGVEVSGEILAMYGLHKAGQHWIERLLPVGVAITHGVFAYNNIHSGDDHSNAASAATH